ncbi:hypothetical protein GEV33_003312 [Tenebrio molitor]|uniref:Uncharacterized protein n=1 Tax=Tenebrio molitor TaxID=7067 RepID=A0A8J6HRF9_TENMO|nr:hypothetical protein GEV33_003312 [Tenebrio molitor]
MGVDVQGILETVYGLLEWGAPPKAVKISGRSLLDDLLEFLALIPLEDIEAIVDDHLQTDGAFVAVVEYLQGPEWAELVDTVGAKPAVQDFIQYLNDAGIPVETILAWIDDVIRGAVPGTDPDEEGSLRPILDEVEGILPLTDLLALLNDKLQNSPDFQALYVEISSEDAHTLVEEVRALDEVQRLVQRLIDMGVMVEEALAVVYEFLGWGSFVLESVTVFASKMKFVVILATCLGLSFAAPQPFSLIDDIDDFLNLIDLNQIDALIKDNLQDNGDIIEIATYMKGDEWAGLVAYVRDHPGWIKLKDWLVSKDIAVDDIISEVHDYIQNAELGTASGDRDVNTFLTDLEALIPVDDLLALAVTKLITSPDFQDLFNRVKSEDTHGLVDDVLSLDEVKADIARLTEMGVDVQGILETVYGLLGWGAPPKAVKKSGRSLLDDFIEFLTLFPLLDIELIVEDHLQTDGALVAVFEYLKGPEWAELVDTIMAKPAVQEFIQYLYDAGIPVDEILAWFFNLIDTAVLGTDPDEEGSLRPFLDEIEGILPVDDVVAWVNDKLQNDPDFQAFYLEISSEEAHTLVEEVRALDEVQRLAQRLRDMEVKVDEALAVVYEFLGWGSFVLESVTVFASKMKFIVILATCLGLSFAAPQPFSLVDDIDDFLNLIDLNEIDTLLKDNLQDNGDIIEIATYMKGDEWAGLVAYVRDH